MLTPAIAKDLIGVQTFGHSLGALHCQTAFPKTLVRPSWGGFLTRPEVTAFHFTFQVAWPL